MSTPHYRRVLAVLAATAALGLAVALGGCSSSDPGGAQSTSGAPLAADGTVESRAVGPGGSEAVPQAVDTQKIVRTASLVLTVPSIDQAVAAARGVATGLGGQVTNESVNAPRATATTTPAGPVPIPPQPPTGSSGTLTLEVPADRLDAALEQLSTLGQVEQRTSSAKDVTTTYVDTESRIATKKASIERVRALMAQASGISQIVELETQLAQRESELESLQATLAALQKKVAMASVTVTVTADQDAGGSAGFLGGLGAGWAAFVGFLGGTLTVLGAVLPFLGALAILALPLLVWWRRRKEGTPQPAASDPAMAPVGATAAPAAPEAEGSDPDPKPE